MNPRTMSKKLKTPKTLRFALPEKIRKASRRRRSSSNILKGEQSLQSEWEGFRMERAACIRGPGLSRGQGHKQEVVAVLGWEQGNVGEGG